MHCEKTITLLNHLRDHHKDISAIIKLQRNLAERRAALFYLKRNESIEYANVLRVYGLTDLTSARGEGVTKKHFHCKRRKGAPAMKRRP
jgi:ribosomal protein S15P/S13E